METVRWLTLLGCVITLLCTRLSEGRHGSGDYSDTERSGEEGGSEEHEGRVPTEAKHDLLDMEGGDFLDMEGGESGIEDDSSRESDGDQQSHVDESQVDLHFENGSGNDSYISKIIGSKAGMNKEFVPQTASQEQGSQRPNSLDIVETSVPGAELDSSAGEDTFQVDKRGGERQTTTVARDQHNTATDAEAAAEAGAPMPSDIQNIIQNLQAELQATRRDETRTRSIMMIIQEQQAKQEADISSLKNEMDQLKRDQQRDNAILTAVQAMVGDNMWALNNVKNEQDHIKMDFVAMKSVQEQQNATHMFMEERMTAAADDHELHDTMMRQLQHEIINLRTAMTQDRNNVKTVVKAVTQKLNNVQLTGIKPEESHQQEVEDIEGNSSEQEAHIEGGDDVTEPLLSSREMSAARLEELVTSMEDQRVLMEESMMRVTRNTHKLRKDLDDLTTKTQVHETEFAKVNTMFYNISLQQTSLENQVLRFQQSKQESQLNDLQRSLMNFTHQALAIQQLQQTVTNQLNTSSQNQHEMSRMSLLVDSMTARLRTMEELVLEYRSSTHSSYGQLLEHMNQVNDSIHEFSNVFSNHDYHASNVFQEMDTDLASLSREMRDLDNRLAHVEVRSLNESLIECQKTNSDVMQDMKLTDFHNGVTKLDDEMAEHTSQILRLDRGLSRLYQDVDQQTTMLRDVVGQVESVVSVVPEVVQLRSQVNSLVEVLPQDCGQIRNTMNIAQEGSYLVKPLNSPHTARVYCQYVIDNGTEESWTLIQKRIDGRLSFARTWQEYKDGFGDPDEEFWVGNDNLHYLTTQGDYELRFEMWDEEGQLYIANYDIFYIDNEDNKYRLHINNYHGNATDSMRYSNYMQFSTLDEDNDVSSTHCAKFYTSGWWYKHCHYSNLNGRFNVGIVWFNQNYDSWVQMTKSIMKIKPRTIFSPNEIKGDVSG